MQVRSLNPARIYQARLRAKLTQDELAHRLRDRGIKASARYINRWEKGVNAPRADVIPVLAEALEVSISELYQPDDADDEEAASMPNHRDVLEALHYSLGLALGKTPERVA